MTEEEAQSWVVTNFSEAARERLSLFLREVVAETASQNLISPGTIPYIWTRHVVDSAQLLQLAPPDWRTWLDIGTGGGFPGMVVALLAPDKRVVMAEPRRRRADFLARCADAFGLREAEVVAARSETVSIEADVISARAVATVEDLLAAAGQCARARTTWLLPRGRSGGEPPADERSSPVFHVEQSLTDASSVIFVGKGQVQ